MLQRRRGVGHVPAGHARDRRLAGSRTPPPSRARRPRRPCRASAGPRARRRRVRSRERTARSGRRRAATANAGRRRARASPSVGEQRRRPRGTRHHRSVGEHRAGVALAQRRGPRRSPDRRSVSSPSSFAQYRAFGSSTTTGSGSAIARRSSRYASSALDGATTFSPAVCDVVGLGALAVVLLAADPAEGRDPDRDRQVDAPARARRASSRRGRHDLLERRVGERVELHLDHAPPPGEAQPHRGAGDAGLADRRVEDAVVAELGLQPVGDAEDAARAAHVLAEHQQPRVLRERVAAGRGSAPRTSSTQPPERLLALSRRNGAGGSAYVQSNIHSTGGASLLDEPARTSSTRSSASASYVASTKSSSAWPALRSHVR